jgi:hypothetical protein
MKKLLLTIVIGFTLINYSQAQNQTIETSVDSLTENSYRLSFSFPEKPLYSGDLQNKFPFKVTYSTQEKSSYTVDSVRVKEDSLNVDIYLTLHENKLYHFMFEDVLYNDSTQILNPLLVRFDNTVGERIDYPIYVSYFDAITKQRYEVLDLDDDYLNITIVAFDAKILNRPYLLNSQNSIEITDSLSEKMLNDKSYVLDMQLLTSKKYDYPDEYNGETKIDGTNADSVIVTMHVELIDTDREEILSNTSRYFFWHSGIKIFSPADTSELFQQIIEISTSTEESPSIPQKTTLSAYPNPFNPSTQIQYTLPEAASVTISVFNVLGQQVRTLAEGTRSSGAHTITFNATGLPAGMYVVRLESTGQSGKVFTETKKVMLLK